MKVADVVVETALNRYYDEPCPNCGDPFNVDRGSTIGIALRGRGRLCSACITLALPAASIVRDAMTDLARLLNDATDPDAFTTAASALLADTVERLRQPETPAVDAAPTSPPKPPKPIRRRRPQ